METHQIPKVPRGEYRYERRYTKPRVHPYDTVKWELRDATITDHNGQIIFEQKKVETPSFWSQTATNIVASKYFRGRLGTSERESSVRQLLDRVAKTIDAIKSENEDVEVCACLGLLSDGQAERLRGAGADAYNHNLNTSEAT